MSHAFCSEFLKPSYLLSTDCVLYRFLLWALFAYPYWRNHKTTTEICAVLSFNAPNKWMHPFQASTWSCPSFTVPRTSNWYEHVLSAFTEPGGISNRFFTPLMLCETSDLVHLQTSTPHAAYHRRLRDVYVDSVSTFTRTMYQLIIKDDSPVRAAHVFVQQLRNFDVFIQRGIEDFFPRLHGFTNVRATSSTLQKNNTGSSSVQTRRPHRETVAGSSS